MEFGAQRILADQLLAERGGDRRRRIRMAEEGRFAYSLQAVVGGDAHEHPVVRDERLDVLDPHGRPS